jgi:hypothetical protein
MANGYLGKISAVVSANTADFQSKLNASAKDVQAFARSVQSNLTSASRDAAKSFESIYTPLQKFERSLQAAASMKLSFKGFAGAIKDVDVLRQRLGSMKDSQISLVLKASGMKNITDVREALVGLRAKDLQIVAKVGGIEKVRELRALSAEKRVDFAINLIDSGLSKKLADARAKVQELKATVASVRDGGAAPTGGIAGLASEYREATAEYRRLQELGRQTIKTTLGVNVQKDADVDRILQAGERAEAIRLPVVLDVLGEAAVKEAVTQSQRLRSVAEQINKPFGEAVQKISAMSVEIQASFLPAMKRSQSQVESLKSSIEKGVLPASAIAQQFDVVEKRVSAAVATVNRLAEASQKIGSMKTGRELAFANPALAASLDRGVEMGNKAAGLPAAAIQANPRIAAILGEYQDRANQAAAAYGRLQAKVASGLPTGSAERQLEGLQSRMAALATEFERIYAAEAPDRNADRVGEMSPMDRNAGNLGARTSLGAMGDRTDISDMGRMSSLEDRRRQLARQAIGEDIEAPRRQLAALASSITSVKSQIDTLPDGVRTRFVPAIREAEAEFIRLSAAPNALPGAIDAARQRVQQLSADAARATQAMNFQQSFGGAGAAGLNLGLDQRSLQSYNAQLQILQGAISRASAEARGPAVAAFDRLRTAVATAFDEGNIDSGVQRDRLAAIRTEAIAAAASVSRIRVGSLTRDVARAGDVGRAGFDRFALAANQAGYAIDDFLSSTGGLEFKLRAISNNITQLAFILGGTTGLFIGLGAVIGGQVALGLIKWYNNGRTAEDQTKALNEALARQKSLVEELAEAFKSLGDAMSRGTLSEGGQQTKEFEDQVENIRNKGRESREGRVFDLDRDVQRERAQQNAYNKQLESETDIGRRVVIARQIEQSKAAEREAMDRVRDRPEPTGDDVAGLLERAAVRMEEAGRSQRPSDTDFPVANSIREVAAGLDVGNTPEAIRAQLRALSDATSSVSETSAQTFFGLPTEESATSNVAATAFADMTERLTAKLEAAIEDLAINVVEASRGPAEQIRQAQEEVAKAIELGLPGARVFQAELDKNATALQESIKKLETTFSGKDESGNKLTVEEKEARTKQAQDEIDALQAQRARIAAQSDAFRYERTVDPQRQIDARMGRASSNLGAAGLEDGRIARRMREIENERETIRQRSALPEFQSPEMVRGLQDAEQALNEEAAAIEAATIAVKAFADELNKAAEEVSGNLNSAQQRADEARRADLGNSTPQTQEARRQAEADLERQRDLERQAQTEIAVERDRLEQQQAASPEATRMQQIEEELASGMNPADEERARLAEERTAMETEVTGANSAANADVERARNRNEVMQAREQNLNDLADAARGLGIDPTDKREDELRDAIRAAGRGDLADDFERRNVEDNLAMADAGFTPEERGDSFWDAVTKAGEELAAALARQAEVVNEGAARLAEIDAQIAATPENRREDLIREREALKAQMEDDARASQAKVDAARDASTREAEMAKSGERGRELTRTPEERFKAETEQGLADIQNYFERRTDANNGLRPAGDAEAQAAAEERFRKDREREARTATAAGRGAELGMTDRERFRRDFEEGAGADINARAKELRDKGEDPTKFLRQAISNQMEQVAPMLQQFQEERQNALLQGPSRAALNVSDVSTSQGQSELNRLLRGDDPAKDVNLAELSKQTEKLQEIIDQLKANNPEVLL